MTSNAPREIEAAGHNLVCLFPIAFLAATIIESSMCSAILYASTHPCITPSPASCTTYALTSLWRRFNCTDPTVSTPTNRVRGWFFVSSSLNCLNLPTGVVSSPILVVCIAGGRRFAGGRRRVEEKTNRRIVTGERRGVTTTKTTEAECRQKTMAEVSRTGSGVTNSRENHRRNVVAFNGWNRDMRDC